MRNYFEVCITKHFLKNRYQAHLFQVIFKHARQYRNYDITKRAFQSAKMAL